MSKLDLTEKMLCNKIGKMFELAASKMNCYEVSFCKEWLRSQLCREIVALEETVICQSKHYLFRYFEEKSRISVHDNYKMDEDVMYWAGYLFTYWMLFRDITGDHILSKYDIKNILEQYEVLHTMSMKASIQIIEKEQK